MDHDSHFQNNILRGYQKYVTENDTVDVAALAPIYDYDRKSAKRYKGYHDITWSMTSGFYVNSKFFQQLGGFMEELFVDGLDIEYCFRARKQNYRIVECGEMILREPDNWARNQFPNCTSAVKTRGAAKKAERM